MKRPLSPGYERPRYELGRTLGAGAFSTVRVGTACDGAKVAVKMVHKSRTPASVAQRERDLMHAIGSHAHCVSLLDFFETKLEWALVLELVSGGEVRGCSDVTPPPT